MAINGDGSAKDEQKTRFSTREGVYNLLPLVEYYRPNRSNFSSTPIPLNSVQLSLITIPGLRDYPERLCLNIGKELYIYVYKGIKSGADMATQIEKKTFKTMNPTCHNFNTFSTTSESIPLLVGFNTGIITLQDLIRKDVCKVFNEEKLVDNSKVTCIRWVPNSRHFFLSSHASGQLYLYNEELPCSASSPPNYQLFKSGEGYAIHVCKTKSTRNPLYRWVIGSENSSINEFAFSPCNLYLAVVSQDGFLRVFHYDTMELVGIARSYFGGLLCVCWSPDSKYVAVGGEDDLVTIWSFHEKQIVARGQGHHSWINVVAFDPYTSSYSSSADQSSDNSCFSTCYRLGSVGQDTQLCLWDITEDVLRQPIFCSSVNIKPKINECSNNGDAFALTSSNHINSNNCIAVTTHNNNNNNNNSNINSNINSNSNNNNNNNNNNSNNNNNNNTNNNHHHLHNHHHNHLVHRVNHTTSNHINNNNSNINHNNNYNNKDNLVADSASSSIGTGGGVVGAIPKHSPSSIKQRVLLTFVDKRGDGSVGCSTAKKYSSRSNSSSSEKYSGCSMKNSELEDPMKLIGTAACPRFDQCSLLEPLICKKISNERLSALIFKEDCILTSCYDGSVFTWARPGNITSSNAHLVTTASSMSTTISNDSTNTVV